MNMHQTTKRSCAVAIAVIVASCAITPSSAAPVLTSTAMLQSSWSTDVVDVQYRRRSGGNRDAAIGAGVALGVLGIIAGAAAQSNPYYAPGYYGSGYYEPGYPAPIYVAPPVIYAPGPVYAPRPYRSSGPRQCWVVTDRDRGFGYWTPC